MIMKKKMTNGKKMKTTQSSTMKKNMNKLTRRATTRLNLGPKASGSKTTNVQVEVPKASEPDPVPGQFEILPGGSLVQQRQYLDGPENSNARYILVQVDRTVPDPGRVLLNELNKSGIDWIKVIYTDPNYIRQKVKEL
jgi:hypothetical protein